MTNEGEDEMDCNVDKDCFSSMASIPLSLPTFAQTWELVFVRLRQRFMFCILTKHILNLLQTVLRKRMLL